MYSYEFVFYKPGKRFYTQREVFLLTNDLTRGGFESSKGSWGAGERVERVRLDLYKPEVTFSLHLGPAEEGFHGAIGLVSVPEEQFETNAQENTKLLQRVAFGVIDNLRPLFTWGDHELEIRKLEPFLRFDRINALAWANFFSQELVEGLGGIRGFLSQLTPEEEREFQQRVENSPFLHIQLADLPTEATDEEMVWETHRHFPEAMLRSFEIPSAKAIERVEG